MFNQCPADTASSRFGIHAKPSHPDSLVEISFVAIQLSGAEHPIGFIDKYIKCHFVFDAAKEHQQATSETLRTPDGDEVEPL